MNHNAVLSLTGQTAADRVLLVNPSVRAGQTTADRILLMDRAGQTAADRILLMDRAGQTAADRILLMDRAGQTAADRILLMDRAGQTAADRILLMDRAGQTAADRILLMDPGVRAGQTAAHGVKVPHLGRGRKSRAARQIAGGAAAQREGSQRKNSDNPLFQFVFLSGAGEREEAELVVRTY